MKKETAKKQAVFFFGIQKLSGKHEKPPAMPSNLPVNRKKILQGKNIPVCKKRGEKRQISKEQYMLNILTIF